MGPEGLKQQGPSQRGASTRATSLPRALAWSGCVRREVRPEAAHSNEVTQALEHGECGVGVAAIEFVVVKGAGGAEGDVISVP